MGKEKCDRDMREDARNGKDRRECKLDGWV